MNHGAPRIWTPVDDQADRLRLSTTTNALSFGKISFCFSPVFYADSHCFATLLRSTIALLERDPQKSKVKIRHHPTVP